MSIIKCPRCDINFIREEEQYCSICKREMKGEMPKEELTDMCIECGEHPAAAGEELCIYCLNDRKEADDAIETDDDLTATPNSDSTMNRNTRTPKPLTTTIWSSVSCGYLR